MARKITENGVRRRKAAFVQSLVVPGTSEAGGNGNPTSLEEEIRRRAYEIYVERGSTPGNESEDWLVAEREVRTRQVHAGQPS